MRQIPTHLVDMTNSRDAGGRRRVEKQVVRNGKVVKANVWGVERSEAASTLGLGAQDLGEDLELIEYGDPVDEFSETEASSLSGTGFAPIHRHPAQEPGSQPSARDWSDISDEEHASRGNVTKGMSPSLMRTASVQSSKHARTSSDRDRKARAVEQSVRDAEEVKASRLGKLFGRR